MSLALQVGLVRYYDRKAMKMLEEMRSKIEEKSLEVKEVGRILRVQAA
ncbi:MAG: hypothetical protein ABSF52_17580 [Syntrophobacteraceae bacterium]|jgi:hypothetical protein